MEYQNKVLKSTLLNYKCIDIYFIISEMSYIKCILADKPGYVIYLL